MTRKSILITGGSGFVGSQLVYTLAEQGHDIVVVDRKITNKDLPAVLWEEDYAEYFKTCTFKHDLVIHLAAETTVANSVLNPAVYYENNVVKMQVMLDGMRRVGMDKIIFSSTGNVYGDTNFMMLTENRPYNPLNPYACTKVAGELLLQSYARAYGMQYVIFRYFNVCGADPKGRTGYTRRPHSHIVPLLCKAAIDKTSITLNGDDWSTFLTPDGTCVRDYLHVADLAQAHLNAMDYMDKYEYSNIFNLGGKNKGVSLKQLVKHASDITGYEIPIIIGPPREGDPERLVADISQAIYWLKWNPQYDIKDAIQHAWDWEKKNVQMV